MSKIQKLSNSSIERFVTCPRSYYWDYLAKDKPPKGEVRDFYAHYGTLLHFFAEMYPQTNCKDNPHTEWTPNREGELKGIEDYLNAYGNQLMERDIALDVEKMTAIYNQLFPMIRFETDKAKNEYYRQGIDFIERIPTYDWSQVIGLEQRFRIDLGNGVVPITGVIDKVERDDKGIVVTDYKSSKPYSPSDILKKQQLPLYGIACYAIYGEVPYKYRYDFVRFGKTVEVEIPLERLEDVKNSIKFRYAQMLAFERNGDQFPAQYDKFFCNSFCPYSAHCDLFQSIHG